MSALQKVKAYFGMVPADEDAYDDYDAYGDYDAYDRGRSAGYDGYDGPGRYSDGDYVPAGRGSSRYRVMDEFEPAAPAPSPRPRMRAGGGHGDTAVQGALAMDRRPEPVTRLHPVPDQARAPMRETAQREQPSRDPLSRITTLHPTSYAEARAVGEHYRDGVPVIMNLTEMENADAKRLVDFAAGLAFALHGALDKVTNKVFLLSPPDIDVSAEDRRRIAEDGMFLRR